MSRNKSNGNELTDRQTLVLQLLRQRILEAGIPPSLREIARELGIKSVNGVFKHLRALEKKGKIKRQSATSRGISLVDSPVVLPLAGKISAGRPLMAIEQPERIDFRPLFTRGRFCFVVEGCGLPKAHIGPGDVVIVDRTIEPRMGQPIVDHDGKLAVQQRRRGSASGTVVGIIRNCK